MNAELDKAICAYAANRSEIALFDLFEELAADTDAQAVWAALDRLGWMQDGTMKVQKIVRTQRFVRRHQA